VIYGLLIGLHVLVSVFLILVVLLQTGKGADLAGAFGGGGSQTAFGSRGAATVLSKMTTIAAVVFMLTSFSLAIYSARGSASVLDATGVPEASSPDPAEAGAAGPPPAPEAGQDVTAETSQPQDDGEQPTPVPEEPGAVEDTGESPAPDESTSTPES
jgi:preprotein translocase subunit SecG